MRTIMEIDIEFDTATKERRIELLAEARKCVDTCKCPWAARMVVAGMEQNIARMR